MSVVGTRVGRGTGPLEGSWSAVVVRSMNFDYKSLQKSRCRRIVVEMRNKATKMYALAVRRMVLRLCEKLC